jgi:hypothetical protein
MSSRRAGAIAVLAAGVVLVGITAVRAASALAVGQCGAYGYGLDFAGMAGAEAAALTKCGAKCSVVARTRKGCAAFAVDIKNVCGAHGWSVAGRLGRAQNAALKQCYGFGGRACVIRAFLCDAKG